MSEKYFTFCNSVGPMSARWRKPKPKNYGAQTCEKYFD